MTVYAYHPSPVGPLLLVGHPQPDGRTALTRVLMQDQKHSVPVGTDWVEDPAAFTDAARQLDEYFAGTRRTFELPLDPAGTAFQLAVWEQLRTIPSGTTTTYGDIAARVGKPHASRAVGAAIGRNPIGIIVLRRRHGPQDRAPHPGGRAPRLTAAPITPRRSPPAGDPGTAR
jgi:methylated-DNA-[protein]-cysteine S-methyltransferase